MEKIKLLVRVFFFKELDAAELVKISSIVRVESLHMGQKVFEARSESDAFYIIKSGSVMVKKGPLVLATPGAGDPVGEMSFMDRGERSATVAAIEDTVLLKIPFAALDDLFDAEPRLAAKIYKALAAVLSQRLREMGETINTKFQPTKF